MLYVVLIVAACVTIASVPALQRMAREQTLWPRILAGALLTIPALVLGYLVYWYLGSPVPSGVYPGRVGGAYFDDSGPASGSTYRLPVIWVRPYPWAELPPTLAQAALVGKEGEPAVLSGDFRPELQWLHPTRPVWLESRAVLGTLALPFRGDPFTATGVRFRWPGEPDRTYAIGHIDLYHVTPQFSPVKLDGVISQWSDWNPPPDGVLGYYLWVSGTGTLLDIISPLAGMEGTPKGLLYREGSERFGTNQAPYKRYQPVTLPMEIHGPYTIYVPLPPAGQQHLRDTHYSLRFALVVQDNPKPLIVPASGFEWGMRTDYTKWRYWVPYFVYTPVPAGN